LIPAQLVVKLIPALGPKNESSGASLVFDMTVSAQFIFRPGMQTLIFIDALSQKRVAI
jgi:hypothetical protein